MDQRLPRKRQTPNVSPPEQLFPKSAPSLLLLALVQLSHEMRSTGGLLGSGPEGRYIPVPELVVRGGPWVGGVTVKAQQDHREEGVGSNSLPLLCCLVHPRGDFA